MVPREPIYKGATRPAMKLGVPLVPLVALCGAGMLASMWGAVLVGGWVAAAAALAVVPTLAWMRWATRLDDQRLRQLLISARLRRHDRNRRLWHARSYCPNLLRGARDDWHA